MGWDGMTPGLALFGCEAVWSEDVPDANIHVKCGATPSTKISRMGLLKAGRAACGEDVLRTAKIRALSGPCCMPPWEQPPPWLPLCADGK